jgi:hypothetical protein
MGQGQQGGQFAGQQAAVRTGQGDLDFGYGATRAGQETSYGNAQAANRSTGVNNLLNVAGTAAKAAAAFSDVRLKRDIKMVGSLPTGLPTYEFSYIGHPGRFIGVMAQEALEFAPWAVVMDESGYLKVDYSVL